MSLQATGCFSTDEGGDSILNPRVLKFSVFQN